MTILKTSAARSSSPKSWSTMEVLCSDVLAGGVVVVVVGVDVRLLAVPVATAMLGIELVLDEELSDTWLAAADAPVGVAIADSDKSCRLTGIPDGIHIFGRMRVRFEFRVEAEPAAYCKRTNGE